MSEVVGLGAWPATSADWSLAEADGGGALLLRVALAAQPATAVPGPGADPGPVAAAAAAQADQLEAAGAQFAEPRADAGADAEPRAGEPAVHAALLTPLGRNGNGERAPQPLLEGTAPLRRYLAGAALYARAAAALEPLPLPDGAATTGTVTLPAETPLVPCAARAGETLTSAAERLGCELARLTTESRALPGLLPAGSTVTVGELVTTVRADDSLDELWRRLASAAEGRDSDAGAAAPAPEALDFDTVIAAVATAALAPGALLAAPAPALETASTVAAAAITYGVDPLAFAQANAALTGLLAEGVEVAAPSGALRRTLPGDTLNALLTRFAADGEALSLARLLDANAEVALFAAGARALLPPPPATVSAALGRAIAAGQPAVPLVTTLRLQRDGDDGAPAEQADTVVPAPADAAQRLAALAPRLLAAAPALRFATAAVADDDAPAPPASAPAAGAAAQPPVTTVADDAPAPQVWAVDFGSGGIAALSFDDPPHAFALRPLYRALQQARDVPLPTLDGDGRLGEARATSFSAADVEPWARRLLADLDLILAPASIAGLRAHAAADDDLDALLRLRDRLAGALAAGLAPLSAAAGDLAAAAGAVAAIAVADGLATAADATLALQYETLARSPFGHPPAPAALLLGAVAAADDERDGGLAATSAPAGPTSGDAATRADADDDARFSRMHVPLQPPPSSAALSATVAAPAAQLQLAPGPLRFNADGLQLDLPEAPLQLAFVRPLRGGDRPTAIDGDLGAPLLPVALRELPGAPQPPQQHASASATTDAGDPPPLAQAGRWTFAAVVALPEAAQDELLVAVELGAPDAPAAALDAPRPATAAPASTAPASTAPAPRADPADLATALWRWISLSDEIRAQVGARARGEAPGSAILSSAVTLLDPLATAWESHWNAARADEDDAVADPHDLRLRVEWEHGPEPQLRAVVLTRADPDAATPLPRVAWREPDGGFSPLLPDPAGIRDGALAFTPASPTARGDDPAQVQLTWSELDVAVTQCARLRLATRRNAHLPHPGSEPVDRSAGAAAAVDQQSPFVTVSPPVSAAAVAPSLDWAAELPIAGASLSAALREAFAQLFGDATDLPLTLQLAFGAAPADLRSWLPVALLPATPLTPALADEVGAVAARWLETTDPPTAGAAWGVTVTLVSPLPGEPPLLRLERLLYELPPA